MTNDEALRIISKDHIVTIYHDEDVSVPKWREAIKVAQLALVKRMPLQPHAFGFKAECPYCSHKVYDDMKYCSNCGQALDWGR